MPIGVGPDDADVTGKTLTDPFPGQQLRQFPVQKILLPVLRREGDDEMLQIHFLRVPVLSVLPFQLFRRHGKGEGRTVDPLQIVFLPGDVFSALIDEEPSPFIRLIHQIIQDAPVVLPLQRMPPEQCQSWYPPILPSVSGSFGSR